MQVLGVGEHPCAAFKYEYHTGSLLVCPHRFGKASFYVMVWLQLSLLRLLWRYVGFLVADP